MGTPLRDRLIGAWKLVDVVELPAGGGPERRPFGERPLGLILYTPDGYMSAQLAERASGDGDGPRHVAYSGTFVVDEDAGTVAHGVVISLRPDWVGTEQLRTVTFDGDELVLAIAVPRPSGAPPAGAPTAERPLVTTRIRWRRAGTPGCEHGM